MDCQKLDKDPQKDNLQIIAVWGHGLGVTFDGKLGVVTNHAECGGYFLPERDERGNRIPVQREYIGHTPESGMNIQHSQYLLLPDLTETKLQTRQ